MVELELELVLRVLTLLIVLVVLAFAVIAYHRTRRRQLLVLVLLATLLGVDILLTVGEEILEEGVPFFSLFTSLFALGIALLLLATILRRFS